MELNGEVTSSSSVFGVKIERYQHVNGCQRVRVALPENATALDLEAAEMATFVSELGKFAGQ